MLVGVVNDHVSFIGLYSMLRRFLLAGVRCFFFFRLSFFLFLFDIFAKAQSPLSYNAQIHSVIHTHTRTFFRFFLDFFSESISHSRTFRYIFFLLLLCCVCYVYFFHFCWMLELLPPPRRIKQRHTAINNLLYCVRCYKIRNNAKPYAF